VSRWLRRPAPLRAAAGGRRLAARSPGGRAGAPRAAARRGSERAERVRTGFALDGGVLASVAVLVGLGVVMIYSTTAPLAMGKPVPPHFVRHAVALALAAACAAGALRVPLRAWRRLALPLWWACMGLLALTLAFGVEVNGARCWLRLFGLNLQPAEFAKWTGVLAAAAVLGRSGRGAPRLRALGACLGLTALPVGLLLLQPDLGSAAILVAVMGLLLFVAGTPPRLLAAPAGAAALGVACYVALRPYALARWRGFLAPWQTARDEGFQLVQSFVAFGRGGLFGAGLGDGRQKLFYLPEAHTDFILSVVAEELGLAGVLLVLGAFAAFALAGLRIAARAREPFALLVAAGMTALVAVPAAVNAAVVMGCLPTTGFTLPFLSFGSNSLLVCGLAVGVLLRVAACEGAAPAPRIGDAQPRGVVAR
jgi:cell division protein FtsW